MKEIENKIHNSIKRDFFGSLVFNIKYEVIEKELKQTSEERMCI